MSFYLDPSFFVALALAVAGAAFLGLRERPMATYGLVVSVLFLVALFWGDATGALAFLLFLALAILATYVLFARPGSRARFYGGVALVLAPLVIYKVTVSLGLGAGVNQAVAAWASQALGAAAQGASATQGAAAFAPTASPSAGAGLLGFMGISYVTFKAVQVLMETHDGLIERMRVRDYLYFLLFFPVFTSGPIDRSRRFAADIARVPSRDEYAGMLARGILLLLLGMVYSMVIAPVFHQWDGAHRWGSGPFGAELLGQLKTMYAYGLYLFFDFAGYSFMAMGAGYCLGVRVPRNFHAPFLAVDLKDFWNRWNITLSTWLRDFVFMRFSRVALARRWFKSTLVCAQVGLILNMFIMGLWHGLTADYIVYGLYHGVLLAATEGFQKKAGLYKHHRHAIWYRVLSWFVTVQLVMVGLAIFSGQAATMLGLR